MVFFLHNVVLLEFRLDMHLQARAEIKMKKKTQFINLKGGCGWLITETFTVVTEFYREFKQGFVRLHVHWWELIYEICCMARSCWNHGKILSKSWQHLVEIMATSWQDLAESWIHGKILLKSWQNLGKILLKSWQDQYWQDLGKIIVKSHKNLCYQLI